MRTKPLDDRGTPGMHHNAWQTCTGRAFHPPNDHLGWVTWLQHGLFLKHGEVKPLVAAKKTCINYLAVDE